MNERGGKPKEVLDFIGTFHAFGVDFEEFETGPGNYSTAIVEREDGRIRTVPVDMVRFLRGNLDITKD